MFAGLVLTGCSPLRSYEALLVLSDIGAANAPSRWKTVTPEPSCTPVTYTVVGRQHTGDLYLPGEGVLEAGIVLVPGAVPQGKDDPRLVALALTLARARFAVLAPDLPGFRALQIRPTDVRKVADAFAYLASRPDLACGGRVGLFGFSYVDIRLSHLFSWQFVSRDLPDVWRMYRVIDALLAERARPGTALPGRSAPCRAESVH
jgi:hypothetical protein